MASVQNIGLNHDNFKEMSRETIPIPPNKTPTSRDSYWFAHGGLEETLQANMQSDHKTGDAKDQQQKDKEERIRIFREHQEEERVKKLKELEQQFMMSKKHREQLEEERRRKIEEARARELERRHQVEERKRQIWEAEQERKEAILRRNMEREARIEARRNAQRNSQCFAFGSSTPRTFDLDLAAIGIGRNVNQGSVLMSAISGRRSEERDLGPPRATSACSLDRKFGDDCMSRSMVSLSSSTFRGRKRTDIMPTLTRERSTTPHITPRGNQSMRAVSMTRLDQLAQPRRTYPRVTLTTTTTTTTNGGMRTSSPSMSKSMCNLANSTLASRRAHVPATSPNQRNNMSRSMLHLPDGTQNQRDNHTLSPTLTQPQTGMMRSAQSMMHLAAPPRLTRAARLRAQALARGRAASAWNLNKADTSGNYLSPGKDSSRSPSRPQSSMSGTSDISATSSSVSAVNMRIRSAPRRPRPISVAGSIADSSVHSLVRREFERPTRQPERSAPVPAPKPERTKSASREKADVKHVTAPKKPVPPPKSSEVLARAKSHPVPTKDNLRRGHKLPVNKTEENKISAEQKGKPKPISTEKIDCKRKTEINEKPIESHTEVQQVTPLVSPTVDVSSDDSKASMAAEIDSDSVSQSAADSEVKIINLDKNSWRSDTVSNQASPEKTATEKLISENIPTEIVEKPNDVPPEKVDSSSDTVNKEETVNKEMTSSTTRITSEEEARAALAEKRRLAREKAEREAELERQRQEEMRRQEEERKRQEEEEQKRMEEEQIRLAELHRQMEEDKLRRAIEEQKQREKEEQDKRDEEARQKAEREEQERKAREEAEKQRIELAEKLRKEEEERAERKRRVEQIMARTRGKTAQSPSTSTPDSMSKSMINTENSVDSPTKLMSSSMIEVLSNGTKEESLDSKVSTVNGSAENSLFSSTTYTQSVNPPLPDLLSSDSIANCAAKTNGQHVSSEEQIMNVSVSNSYTMFSSNGSTSANEATSPQSNGYSSHEDMSCTTSPEENTETGLLIDIQSGEQKNSKISQDFTKLVDLEPPSLDNNVNNENFLINTDEINSNLLNSGNPFVSYDDSLQKKQDTPVADLLS